MPISTATIPRIKPDTTRARIKGDPVINPITDSKIVITEVTDVTTASKINTPFCQRMKIKYQTSLLL